MALVRKREQGHPTQKRAKRFFSSNTGFLILKAIVMAVVSFKDLK